MCQEMDFVEQRLSKLRGMLGSVDPIRADEEGRFAVGGATDEFYASRSEPMVI